MAASWVVEVCEFRLACGWMIQSAPRSCRVTESWRGRFHLNTPVVFLITRACQTPGDTHCALRRGEGLPQRPGSEFSHSPGCLRRYRSHHQIGVAEPASVLTVVVSPTRT